MFKKLADRKILIVTVIALLVLIGVIVVLSSGKTTKDPDKHPDKDIVEQNQDEEPYDGDGLDVQEDEEAVKGEEQQEEGVKAPSSWGNEADDEGQTEQDEPKDDTTGDETNPDTTDKSDQDSDDKGDMESNDLPDEEQDTLWGTIF
jgi:hypothetical protein